MNSEEIQDVKQTLKLTENEIFTRIWMSPRIVFKYLNDNKIDSSIATLLILAGIVRAFNQASLKNMGDDMSLIAVICVCVFLGGIFGWITYYIYAALLSWTGKWLGSKGDTNALLRMMAYALIPSILALVLLIPQIAIYGNGIFQTNFDISSNGLVSFLFYYITIVFEFILSIWTLVVFIIGISEVQKLSIGKSILNMILPGLIILGPIILIALIVRTVS